MHAALNERVKLKEKSTKSFSVLAALHWEPVEIPVTGSVFPEVFLLFSVALGQKPFVTGDFCLLQVLRLVKTTTKMKGSISVKNTCV